MKTKTEFAQTLQTNRLKYKLTQRELAEAVGMTESAIIKYENSQRMPGYNDLMRLNDFLLADDGIKFIINSPEYTEKVILEFCHYLSISKNELLQICSAAKFPIENVIRYYVISRTTYMTKLHIDLEKFYESLLEKISKNHKKKNKSVSTKKKPD